MDKWLGVRGRGRIAKLELQELISLRKGLLVHLSFYSLRLPSE